MTVRDLLRELRKLPQDYTVIMWDEVGRVDVESVSVCKTFKLVRLMDCAPSIPAEVWDRRWKP